MRSILTLLLVTSCTYAFAQDETPAYKKVSDQFVRYYNAGLTDSIFSLFNGPMKKFIPIEKTAEFVNGTRSELGSVTGQKFTKYKSGAANYKTNFEKGIMSFSMSLDDEQKISGLNIAPYVDDATPIIERTATKMRLPFNGEWTVTWGGDTKELNYHVESKAQKNAFDILITDSKGETHKQGGQKNEDYFAFGKELVAPCDAEIVLAVDGIKDNKPGDMNRVFITGNTVILKTPTNEYLLFAHMKQYSVKVKQGQKVKRGQALGLCGNSGHSSEPHLHFHVQNIEDMSEATGVKCYFDKLVVNGLVKTDYSPIQGDKIKPE